MKPSRDNFATVARKATEISVHLCDSVAILIACFSNGQCNVYYNPNSQSLK